MNRRMVLKFLATSSLIDTGVATASAEEQILELSCHELVARIRDGSVRAERVCERFLQQYERQRSLNVITWIDQDGVLSQARNVDLARDRGARLPALAGLPILVKDNIDTVGFPTSAGTASLKQDFPSRNAVVVERLMRQGVLVMGKANMHELSFGVTSSNPTFGFVHNPYDPDLIPGGSSGGSAAAIAARIAPAALGTDTVGSVRIPAAFCGTVGFRPSVYPRKVYSDRGVVPGTRDFDTIGPMARSVADVALLHAAIMAERNATPRILERARTRIGIPRNWYWQDLHPEVERVAQDGLGRLRGRGAELVDVDLDQVRAAAMTLAIALASPGLADLENFLRIDVPSVSMDELRRQIASRDVRADVDRRTRMRAESDLLHARGEGRRLVCATYAEVFRKHGIQALLFPTVVLPPPPIRVEGDDPDETIEFKGRAISKLGLLLHNTLTAAALGGPALSLPVGLTSDGLPVGLELDGVPGADSALLSLGISLEHALGSVPPPSNALR